jgi:hypothetical protein
LYFLGRKKASAGAKNGIEAESTDPEVGKLNRKESQAKAFFQEKSTLNAA